MKSTRPVRRNRTKAGRTRTPRFTRVDPELRRHQIIEAAIRCLGRGGGANLTTSAIMAEARVSRGLIHHYFPSQSLLLVEAYKLMIGGLSSKATDDMRRRSSGEAMDLKAMVEVAFSPLIFEKLQNQAWLELWALMSSEPELSKFHSKVYRNYRRELVAAIECLAKKRRKTIDVHNLATATIALVDGLWLNWSIDSRFVPATEAKRACYNMLEAHLGPL
ncbi:MAG: TetR family transcriptional regulator C-terminal domain-containing protein [Hyphomicrobiaceae bacterium]